VKRYLTERANKRLQDIFYDRQVPRPPYYDDGHVSPFPERARALSAVAKDQIGTFRLQSGVPGLHDDTAIDREAYAACAISQNDIVSLLYHVGDSSGGYWLASKCDSSSGTYGTHTTPCSIVDGGQLPSPISVRISGVVGGEGDPGAATAINTTHVLSRDIHDCKRGRESPVFTEVDWVHPQNPLITRNTQSVDVTIEALGNVVTGTKYELAVIVTIGNSTPAGTDPFDPDLTTGTTLFKETIPAPTLLPHSEVIALDGISRSARNTGLGSYGGNWLYNHSVMQVSIYV